MFQRFACSRVKNDKIIAKSVFKKKNGSDADCSATLLTLEKKIFTDITDKRTERLQVITKAISFHYC